MIGESRHKIITILFVVFLSIGTFFSIENIIFSFPFSFHAQDRVWAGLSEASYKNRSKTANVNSEIAQPVNYAPTALAKEDLGTGVDIPNAPVKVTNFDTYISAILAFSYRAGGALALLMIIFAGYKYMTSQGNPTAINEAKEIISGAIIGLALLLLIALVLNILNLPNITVI